MKLREKILKVQTAIHWHVNKVSDKLDDFLSDERGDTNFISIVVVLAIALVVAGIFIGFKDTIITKAQDLIAKFDLH